MIIQRLKERITQLDVENSLLTKASSRSIEHEDIDLTIDDDHNQQDLDTLMKRIAKLKVLVRVVNTRFDKSLTIEGKYNKFKFDTDFYCLVSFFRIDILNIDQEISSETTNITRVTSSMANNNLLHSKCYEEIDRLKNELEKYRNKTVAAFKVKAFQVLE